MVASQEKVFAAYLACIFACTDFHHAVYSMNANKTWKTNLCLSFIKTNDSTRLFPAKACWLVSRCDCEPTLCQKSCIQRSIRDFKKCCRAQMFHRLVAVAWWLNGAGNKRKNCDNTTVVERICTLVEKTGSPWGPAFNTLRQFAEKIVALQHSLEMTVFVKQSLQKRGQGKLRMSKWLKTMQKKVKLVLVLNRPLKKVKSGRLLQI